MIPAKTFVKELQDTLKIYGRWMDPVMVGVGLSPFGGSTLVVGYNEIEGLVGLCRRPFNFPTIWRGYPVVYEFIGKVSCCCEAKP
jgi:hypothetical protein